MEESRKNGAMLSHFNTTDIVLIPKIQQPKIFIDFRLIALCNIIYKIFTKAINLRLQAIIKNTISPQQGGFNPRRKTTDGAIVAHEVLHSIKQHNILSCVVKLDMMVRAYDKVKWASLHKVLLIFFF